MSQSRYSSLENKIKSVYSINTKRSQGYMHSITQEKTQNFRKKLESEFTKINRKKGPLDMPDNFYEAKNRFGRQ